MIVLKSKVRKMQVFNVPHLVAEKMGDWPHQEQTVTVVVDNPATGERKPKRVKRKFPKPITLLALTESESLPDAVESIPEVQTALARNEIKIIKGSAPKEGPLPAPKTTKEDKERTKEKGPK